MRTTKKQTENDFISLDYVVDFFYTIGFTWELEYFNHKEQRYKNAEKFEDIVSDWPRLTTLQLYSGENQGQVDFLITPALFKRYREIFEVQGSQSQMELVKDYSNEWQRFVLEKKSSETKNTP